MRREKRGGCVASVTSTESWFAPLILYSLYQVSYQVSPSYQDFFVTVSVQGNSETKSA